MRNRARMRITPQPVVSHSVLLHFRSHSHSLKKHIYEIRFPKT
jgi:hypothetical protein